MGRSTSLALLFLLGIRAAASAQGDEGPAARRARQFLDLINRGDRPAILAFVDSVFGGRFRDLPLDAHLNFVFSIRDASRGLDFERFQDVEPTTATALSRMRLTGGWMAIRVRVEPESPHRIVGIGRLPPQVPAGARQAAPRSDAQRVAVLREFVGKLAEADVFSGAVLLARDGKVLYAAAHGEANKDFAVPNRVDTRFNLGSMNKMFTAVAIMQLVEQGKVSLDDPLARFLPAFPDSAAAKKIRIAQLLTHTSGLGSYFTEEFDRSSRARFRTVDDMLQLAKSDTLAFEPGTRWAYSNTGFLVLGKVIEVVAGQDYFAYVREHIHRPAGMVHTDAYELDRVNPNLAVGYEKEFGVDGATSFRNNIFMHVIRGGPAGGGYSTVQDLLRFAEALKTGKLLSAASLKLLTTAKPELNSPEYGFGFGIHEGGSVVGHSGGFSGISANLDIFIQSGYVAAVMSNYGRAASYIVERTRELVPRQAAP